MEAAVVEILEPTSDGTVATATTTTATTTTATSTEESSAPSFDINETTTTPTTTTTTTTTTLEATVRVFAEANDTNAQPTSSSEAVDATAESSSSVAVVTLDDAEFVQKVQSLGAFVTTDRATLVIQKESVQAISPGFSIGNGTVCLLRVVFIFMRYSFFWLGRCMQFMSTESARFSAFHSSSLCRFSLSAEAPSLVGLKFVFRKWTSC
jgi:hypothetical protein